MRGAALLLLVLVAALASAPSASADEWHSQQPLTEGVRAELGEVGDVEFWAPNRGVLITAGNGGVGAGIFAYDGNGWYRYASVCGGHEGRIAWAGPDEFWTISDQPVGQGTGQAPAQHISLCHFKDGQVVASYAEPLGLAGSYLPMNAAACAGPNDCWFAGERLPGLINDGAFHLHWDGASLTAIPSLTQNEPQIDDPGRTVTGLSLFAGALFEGVRAQEGDVAPDEEAEPSLLHRVDPGSPNPFQSAEVEAPIEYEFGTAAQLEGFHFSADGESALWAVSGAKETPGLMTVLRKAGAGPFAQIHLVDPEGVLEFGDGLAGLAAEPGSEYAWLAFRGEGEHEVASHQARLTRVHADGTVDPEIRLPAEGEGLSAHGPAGPIACPAAEQCWLATERGWLFHLGADPAPNADPAMHALITFRPPDDSLPFVPPVDLPEDDSGAASPFEYKGAGEEPEKEPERRLPRSKPLLAKLHQQVIGGKVLELTFVLRAKAHVRLVAKRKQRVVAETPRYTMGSGPRRLRLRLDPDRWPTKLDLQVHPVGKKRAK